MLLLAEEADRGLKIGDCARRPSPRSLVWTEIGRGGGGSRLVRPDEMLSRNELMKATEAISHQS
jgi:hypothetical protein